MIGNVDIVWGVLMRLLFLREIKENLVTVKGSYLFYALYFCEPSGHLPLFCSFPFCVMGPNTPHSPCRNAWAVYIATVTTFCEKDSYLVIVVRAHCMIGKCHECTSSKGHIISLTSRVLLRPKVFLIASKLVLGLNGSGLRLSCNT